ncbi:hypothetical protein NC652_008148 [Populus alba x Populus x berolinensis]|nr:hypothetical protein NC652_008148 [Populus alba x Populus x berolinensis]
MKWKSIAISRGICLWIWRFVLHRVLKVYAFVGCFSLAISIHFVFCAAFLWTFILAFRESSSSSKHGGQPTTCRILP